MANPHNLKVGQKLWYVPSSRNQQPSEVTIEKVGRKWITIEGFHLCRFDLETLRLKTNYGAAAYCYLSREIYEAEAGRHRARIMTEIKITISDKKARQWLATLRHHYDAPRTKLDVLADCALHKVIANLPRADVERMEKLEAEIMNEGTG